MADNNNQNGQDATQQFINILKSFKWRIIDFSIFNYSYIIPNSRILETILIIVLCLIGIGIGYIKDRTQDFLNFLNRWS